ncbi:hypothetical protein Y032_0030g2096 [Ancylostoma ceylanicum]|uniref:Uncharacterized protein n=1 Tax=Ancylostoma ceylanicum TaxID=53326 RepID=A0A016URR7_9BILA|nr:hypothetical protein Y032_0030g2096 [Ancylostoma ceylanicum]
MSATSTMPAPRSRGGITPTCAGCSPQLQRRVNTFSPVRSMRSTVLHVFACIFAKQTGTNLVAKKRV